MDSNKKIEEFVKMIERKSTTRIPFTDYDKARAPEFWEKPKFVDPFIQEHQQEQLEAMIKQLEQQQAQQQTMAHGNIQRYEFNELVKQIRSIEDKLEILLNMLKLILTTQIEKDFAEKSEKTHSEES